MKSVFHHQLIGIKLIGILNRTIIGLPCMHAGFPSGHAFNGLNGFFVNHRINTSFNLNIINVPCFIDIKTDNYNSMNFLFDCLPQDKVTFTFNISGGIIRPEIQEIRSRMLPDATLTIAETENHQRRCCRLPVLPCRRSWFPELSYQARV